MNGEQDGKGKEGLRPEDGREQIVGREGTSKRGLGVGCGYGEQKGILIEEGGWGVGGKGR